MNIYQLIHQNALRAAKQYRRSEDALLIAIQQVDSKKVFLKFGYKNLYEYGLKCLMLSEGTTYAFIRVARKAVEIPEIQRGIAQGAFTLSHAKTIISIITPGNKDHWIGKATSLSVRKLEREVAQLNPAFAITEKLHAVAKNRVKLECGVDEELEKMIRRTKDLLSQRQQKAANLEDTLRAVFSEYLKRNDPLLKTPRTSALSKNDHSMTPAIKRLILQRDNGECQARDPKGDLCRQTRWLDVHHIKHVSNGGGNEPPNLITLCRAHHRLTHLMS